MKAGAFEYVTKPFNCDELLLAVRKALRLKSLEHDNARLRREVGKKYGFENIVGDSPLLQQVFRLIEKAADSDAPVLNTRESGTPRNSSPRPYNFGAWTRSQICPSSCRQSCGARCRSASSHRWAAAE